MNCEIVQEAIFDVLEDATASIPDAEIRAHLDACAACRGALPEIAADWERMNLFLAGPAKDVDWTALAKRVWKNRE